MNIAGVIKDWMLIFFSYSIFQAPVTRVSQAKVFDISNICMKHPCIIKYVKCKKILQIPTAFFFQCSCNKPPSLRLYYIIHFINPQLNLFGYFFCCTGVMIYNWHKLQALQKQDKGAVKKTDALGPKEKDDVGISSSARGRVSPGRSKDLFFPPFSVLTNFITKFL